MTSPAIAALVCGGLTLLGAQVLHAQVDTSAWTTQDDHAHLLQQLGITALRPGRDGAADPDPARAANIDESRANPWPEWPALLISDAGIAIDSAAQWHSLRRAELVEHFEREVVGRVPPQIPALAWEVVATTAADARVGEHAVHGRKLLGHVDNSSFPTLSVSIEMSVVLPAHALGPVPVLMMFGRSTLPGDHRVRAFPAPLPPTCHLPQSS